jgi:hypothetical protein
MRSSSADCSAASSVVVTITASIVPDPGADPVQRREEADVQDRLMDEVRDLRPAVEETLDRAAGNRAERRRREREERRVADALARVEAEQERRSRKR